MRKSKAALLAVITMMSAALCGGIVYAEEETDSEEVYAAEEETEADAITADDINLDGYLTQDADQYVTLGDYEGLDVEKQITVVSDEDVSYQIDSDLYDATTLEDVEGDPEEGDIISVDITFTVDGQSQSQKDYEIYYGYGDIGDSFDTEMAHAKVGDTFDYEETFDEDSYYEDWAGKTVQFRGTVIAIQREVTPELTDEWVQENTGYDTVEAYEEAVREQLQAQADQQSNWNAQYTLIGDAMDNCTFDGYPETLYEACLDETTLTYQSAAEMYDIELNELLEEYGLTQEDLEEEAHNIVNTRLFLSAVALKENITVTAQEVVTLLNTEYEAYGYADPDSFRLAYGDDYLALAVLEDKVGQLLLSTAHVTETVVDTDSDDLDGSIVEDDEEITLELETE